MSEIKKKKDNRKVKSKRKPKATTLHTEETIKAQVKDGKILNLETNRWIKVNGATFNRLINKQILKVKNDTIYFYKGGDQKVALRLKDELKDADLPPDTQLIARNGILSTKQRTVKKDEISSHIQKIAILVYNENKDRIDPNLPTEEIQRLLKPLINQRLINEASLPPLKKTSTSASVKYLLENLPSESDDSEEEFSYEDEMVDEYSDSYVEEGNFTDEEEEKLDFTPPVKEVKF